MTEQMKKLADSPFAHVYGKGFVWINIDSPNRSLLSLLMEAYPFHQLDIEDCLSKTQLPKIDEYPDYLFIVVHFPRFLKEKKFSIPSQVSVFLGRDFLVTVHSGELKPINRLYERCRSDESVRGVYMGISSTYLLYRLLNDLAVNLRQMAGKILSNIEALEDKVFDEKVEATREVTELRHDIANLRRTVFPLKRVIHELEQKVEKFSPTGSGEEIHVSDYFEAMADYFDAVWAIIQECREIIEIYKDTDFLISSDRTNKILALLTIVFTFSIPATVIGTLYGMNVNLPGGVEHPLTFLGPYTTFMLILASALVPVVLMYVIFKKIKWL